MYEIELIIEKMKTTDLLKEYCDKEKFIGFCKKCKNYNNVWSCPPVKFNSDEYLKEYDNAYIIGTKVIYDEKTINNTNTEEKISKVTEETFHDVKKLLATIFLKLEKEYENTKFISSGVCDICNECSRSLNKPCRYPEKMRYSFDSFGVDLSRISSEVLNTEIKWSKGKLPEYYTLVSAFMTNNEIENLKENIENYIIK